MNSAITKSKTPRRSPAGKKRVPAVPKSKAALKFQFTDEDAAFHNLLMQGAVRGLLHDSK